MTEGCLGPNRTVLQAILEPLDFIDYTYYAAKTSGGNQSEWNMKSLPEIRKDLAVMADLATLLNKRFALTELGSSSSSELNSSPLMQRSIVSTYFSSEQEIGGCPRFTQDANLREMRQD